MGGHAIQIDARLGIFEPHQVLTIILDEPLLAGGQVLGGNPDVVADGLGEKVLGAQQVQAGGLRREIGVREITPRRLRLAAGQFFRPAGLQKAQPLLLIRQVNAHLHDVRVAQQIAMQLGRGLGDQHNAHINPRQLRRRGPLQKRDQIDAFLDARPGLVAGRNEFFGIINHQRHAFPLVIVLGRLEEEAGQQRGEGEETLGRPLLVEIGRFDAVKNLEPLKKTLLHLRRAEGEAARDVIKQQAGAFREQSPHQEGFQRQEAESIPVLDREQIENVSVQHEQRIGPAVPMPR